jgi:hypothetical protein
MVGGWRSYNAMCIYMYIYVKKLAYLYVQCVKHCALRVV